MYGNTRCRLYRSRLRHRRLMNRRRRRFDNRLLGLRLWLELRSPWFELWSPRVELSPRFLGRGRRGRRRRLCRGWRHWWNRRARVRDT